MDLVNPGIALNKPRISALHNNPCIVCVFHELIQTNHSKCGYRTICGSNHLLNRA